jgi:hypothetical protein
VAGVLVEETVRLVWPGVHITGPVGHGDLSHRRRSTDLFLIPRLLALCGKRWLPRAFEILAEIARKTQP